MGDSRKWRKLLKKIKRQKRRQKAAQERDAQLSKEEAAKQSDPAYFALEQDEEEALRKAAEIQSQEEEEAWLRRELIAQKQFALERKRREEHEAKLEAERVQKLKELEEREKLKLKQKEENERRQNEILQEFDRTMQIMEEYLTNDHLPCPTELQQTLESKPGEKVCEFYKRTNCCRFGFSCQFNHQRPLLSTIIIVRNFFSHPLLEQSKRTEYSESDSKLEFTDREMREEYDAFFHDVATEMESFGRIINFRTTCNVQIHLRGHVFVEYENKRSALRAFIKLQGRFYAMKRLSVEFSNIQQWRTAVCGSSVARKCPKGNFCNYFHLFRNPNNKYNMPLEREQVVTKNCTVGLPANVTTPLLSWSDIEKAAMNGTPQSWFGLESPEPDVITTPNENNLLTKSMQSDRELSQEGDEVTDNKKVNVSKRHKDRKHKKRKKRSRSRSRSSTRSRSKSRHRSGKHRKKRSHQSP